MIGFGKYEIIVQKALEQIGPGPWIPQDLDKVRDVLTDEVCSVIDPECDRRAIFDWLSALQERDTSDLIVRLNAGHSAPAPEADEGA